MGIDIWREARRNGNLNYIKTDEKKYKRYIIYYISLINVQCTIEAF